MSTVLGGGTQDSQAGEYRADEVMAQRLGAACRKLLAGSPGAAEAEIARSCLVVLEATRAMLDTCAWAGSADDVRDVDEDSADAGERERWLISTDFERWTQFVDLFEYRPAYPYSDDSEADETALASLHAAEAHPAFEYGTVVGPRKEFADEAVPPPGTGWIKNVHKGRAGWERFDEHEEAYWMRQSGGG